MAFNLDQHALRVTNAVEPEELRNITVFIFRELAMRRAGSRVEATGFEDANFDELHQALYYVLNEMVHRIHSN